MSVRMRSTILLLVALLFGISLAGTATAQTEWPVTAGGNGHYYQVVASPGITWSEAMTAAGASTYLGSPGHLVTITSAAENAFVSGLYENDLWIGFNDLAVEGTFVWVTGEPVSYTNWRSGEPNNVGNEDCTHINAFFSGSALWNDNLCSNPAIGAYVIEYDGPFDTDGDGVFDDGDFCPGTVLPDEPTRGLRGARFAAEEDGTFASGLDRFAGTYTLSDTQGCSGAQIIDLEGLGEGHTKFGISKSALEGFIADLSGA